MKSHFSVRSDNIYHVTVMPCYDKKLEASRDDFLFSILDGDDGEAKRLTEVDCVLTSGEMLDLLQVSISISRLDFLFIKFIIC